MRLSNIFVPAILALALTMLIASPVWADTENGMTVFLGKEKKQKFKEVEFFTAYNLGTDAGGTEVFNEAEEVAIDSGAIDISKYNTGGGSIQVNYPTIASTGIDFNIYGRLTIGDPTPTTAWSLLFQIQRTSAQASPTGVNLIVPDTIDEIRVGCKATGTPGVDSITVIGKFKEG